ncbi:hypothetical protein N7462_006362 [Penicillium macrosclerotiorum]|uniref:uncharacterized protein n=1 Tax=Penicillium macrosclerotiorum TaxID=303699 RepID=UPI0025484EEB|nr:uncharacterized protein N7462_006362 [Penicillium macrosclerotiorum]KAJ5683197.1 hypothetical protein N7462_006362 [Penicillium macrosclerotiorum]
MATTEKGSRPDNSKEATFSAMLSNPWVFLHPTIHLHTQIADSAKQILDPLATSIAEGQAIRRKANKKRKRAHAESDDVPSLQLKSLYVDGFTSNQIWEQATRILESAGSEVERDVTLLSKYHNSLLPSDKESPESLDVSDLEDTGSESDDADDMSDHFSDNSDFDDKDAEEDLEELEELEELEAAGATDEAMSETDSVEADPGTYVEDRFGLNDGFFSIDEFNKQTELWERQDAKGAIIDEESDDEVDWHANPLDLGNSMAVANASSRKPRQNIGDDNDEMRDEMDGDSEEEGPTFGNMDLHGVSDTDSNGDDSDTDEADMSGLTNANDIRYADFFAPPPRKPSSKKIRALPKTQPTQESLDDDVDRAMADVRRDLFDESEGEEDKVEESTSGLQGGRSTHEKQRAQIADEIRRLEAANVAKKEWMLAGEARAVERPMNSLIEEDLDFERVGKPVPVVTNETTEDIEALIKRRILAKEFDEVIRRRPGTVDAQASRRGRFELEDTKAQQSLAEIYEADHLRATDPNYVDPKNQKLMREHTEVTNLWKEISSQLDFLSNWNYKPQAPQATINTVSDVSTIATEDARPTAGSAAGGPSALAPQEIYTPGDDGRVAGEVVLKTGATIAKDEMSREQKARMRRQKKTQKKADTGVASQTSKTADKKQLVADLTKGGVKVINKEGQVTDMSGGKVEASTKTRADALKL